MMTFKAFFQVMSVTGLLWLAMLSAPAQVPGLLTVDTNRIVNETACGDAARLFDEPSTLGTTNFPTSTWTTPWSDWYYPVSAVVDLGGQCQLTSVVFFDYTSTGEFEVQALVSNSWVSIMTDGQNRYEVWVTNAVSAQARYVRLLFYSVNVISPEVGLYGWRLEPASPYPAPVTPTPPPFDQFMGVNTVNTDPLGRVEAFGSAREYHDWDWDEGGSTAYPNDTNQWYDSYAGSWNFDLYYQNLSRAGITVSPCKELSVDWLGLADEDDKPIPATATRNPEDPASYPEHADHFYQFAARFGNTPVPDANLKLSASEPRLSGQGTVHYVENWNEPDKTWKGRAGLFLPYEYAAMSDADADGNQGAMGATFGIKNADPHIHLVMAGLAGINLDYVKALNFWCQRNRGGNFLWDVINVHYYCNDASLQPDGQATTGISPEAANFRAQAAALVDYRNRFLPGKEVWMSEFGYDVNSNSPQCAPALGATPAEEVQGCWIARSFLELAAAGIDRAFLFMLSDPQTGSSNVYATSGVIGDYWSGYAVRPAWFYCHTLKDQLRGLHYFADQNSGNPNVAILQFADHTGVVRAYALWCPTTNNVTVNGYTLALAGSPAAANLITLTNGSPEGLTTPLTITGGSVTVNVSERPVLVLADATPALKFPDAIMPLTASNVVNESGLGDAGYLTDEPQNVGDPQDGNGGNPTNIWFPSWDMSDYPANAYIDLGQIEPVSQIYLYDANSTGLTTISAGYPGNWQPLFQCDCRYYDYWTPYVLNVRTRYLRVTRWDEGGNIAEVAVYTNAWINQFAGPTVTAFNHQTNGRTTLSIQTTAGNTVAVWTSTNLSGPWLPLGTNVIGTNGTWQFTTPASGDTQRFYRTGSL